MEVKKCIKCLKSLPFESFYDDIRTSDGKRNTCKSCFNANQRFYRIKNIGRVNRWNEKSYLKRRENKREFLKFSYQRIKDRVSDHKKYPTYRDRNLSFTVDEFFLFAVGNKNFLKLHDKYVKNNFDFNFTPTVDRIDNNLGYDINNIQFLTRSQNMKKDVAKRPVICIESGCLYPSILDASKALGIFNQNIALVVDNPNRTCNGCHWRTAVGKGN